MTLLSQTSDMCQTARVKLYSKKVYTLKAQGNTRVRVASTVHFAHKVYSQVPRDFENQQQLLVCISSTLLFIMETDYVLCYVGTEFVYVI